MKGAVYVNGTITPADQAVIPVYDHGFVYGEGVYETLRTYNRDPLPLRSPHAPPARVGVGPAPRRAVRRRHAAGVDRRHDGRGQPAARLARQRQPRSLHPHPAHARRRRAQLRPEGHARAVARHHREAVRRTAGAHVRRGHQDLARVDPAQPSWIGEPASSSRTTCSTTPSPCRRRTARAARKP